MNLIRKFCNWYFSRYSLPFWCILALDCVIVFLSGLIVYYFQNGGMSLVQHFREVVLGLILCLVIYVIAFVSFHTFRGVMRYSSFVDLHRLAYSMIVASVGVCLLHKMQVHLTLTPYIITPDIFSTFLVFIIATMVMWGMRVIVKTLHDTYRGGEHLPKVFIYGCMQGGISIAKSIRNESPVRYKLRGFVSGDKSLEGSWLLGEQVYYDEDKTLLEVMKKKGN